MDQSYIAVRDAMVIIAEQLSPPPLLLALHIRIIEQAALSVSVRRASIVTRADA